MSAPGAWQRDTFKAPRSFLGEQMTTRLMDRSRKILLGRLVAGTCHGSCDTIPACSPDSRPLPLPLSTAFFGTQLHREATPANCYFTVSLRDSVQLSDLQGLICYLREKILPGCAPILREECPSADLSPHRDQDKAWGMGIKNELTGD